MQKLIEGHRHFLAEKFPARRDEFHLLAEGQSPEVLFLTCADSRIVPDLILQTAPGDLFLCRNAGNVIPRGDEFAGGVGATLEYAVEVLKVRHVIVCGHSDCGVIRALMQQKPLEGLPRTNEWLEHVKPAWDYLDEVERHSEDLTLHTALTHANVLVQLGNLRSNAFIERAIAEGRLQTHGWYYDILSGCIESYDDVQKKFVPLV